MFNKKGYDRVQSIARDIPKDAKISFGGRRTTFAQLTSREKAITWWANHTHRAPKLHGALIVSAKVIELYTGSDPTCASVWTEVSGTEVNEEEAANLLVNALPIMQASRLRAKARRVLDTYLERMEQCASA